jgi:VIT1/CCC1 family predicted Fe2+/Mn2+ transporter
MKHSLRTGLAFGLTSATITTLGLMVGLNAGTGSKLAVLGGVLTIAIADAFSDALGIHISEESKNGDSKQVWEATISTFFSKLVFASTFAVPLLILDLATALIVNICWGLLILSVLSYLIAKDKRESPFKVVSEHFTIGILVIVISTFVGELIRANFG